MRELIQGLEESARRRFVRWDASLWNELVDGPAASLAANLDASVGMAGRPALISYLRLVCEGVGLGYLFPVSAGRDGFMNVAFASLVPRLLPALPPARQTEALAALWNLGENLEGTTPWLRRIFLKLLGSLAKLDDLPGLVAYVEGQALAPPSVRLGAATKATWVQLGAEDRRFVPGRLHFVSPTVVCVHDRMRPGASQGIWIVERPLSLGPMGCTDAPAETSTWRPKRGDRQMTPVFATAKNDWRAAATLVTSQGVLCLAPS